jgi:tRNA threonylcarbamoyladenosine biosynthesis protein TsaE
VKSHVHRTVSTSPEQTHALGIQLGQQAEPGGIITLTGELGSGKTCLAKGIAEGLAVPETYTVTSPTFAIMNEYPGRVRLYHVDLYRIVDVSELEDLGLEEILAGDGVAVIEWAEKLKDDWPADRLDISISIMGDETREFCLTAWGQDAINWVKKCIGLKVTMRGV